MSDGKVITLARRSKMMMELVEIYNEPTAVDHFYSPLCEAMGSKEKTVSEFTREFIAAVEAFFLMPGLKVETKTSFLLHIALMLMCLVKDQGVLFAMIPQVCSAVGPKVDPEKFLFKVGDRVLTNELLDHGEQVVLPQTVGTVIAADMSSAGERFRFGGQMAILWEGQTEPLNYYFNALPPYGGHTNGWDSDFELLSE